MSSTTEKYDELLFFWGENVWLEYLAKKNIDAIITNLIQDMDSISVQYIEKHISLIKLLPYKEHILLKRHFLLLDKDFEDAQRASEYASTSPLTFQELFLYANKYGLHDVPQERLAAIDGTCIVDGGAFTGDTLCLFATLFPQAKIFALEPQQSAFEQLQENIRKKNLKNCIPIAKGLSNISEHIALYTRFDADSAATCHVFQENDTPHVHTIHTTTIDTLFQHNPQKVGLIKLDVEGHEKKALLGAKSTIERHKPLIVAAIYHSPTDFFEIKELLQSYNPQYRFMVRRSEMVMAMADLVLIAY